MRRVGTIGLVLVQLAVAGCAGGPAGEGDHAVAPETRGDEGSAPDLPEPDAPSDGGPEVPSTLDPAPAYGFCEPNVEDFPVRVAPTAPATLPPLRVQGKGIVDDQGNPVALRGINFGAWMMMETWIAGIGVTFEGELLDAFDLRAEELGLTALLEEAKALNAFEWLVEQRSHWACVQEWRAYMSAQAGAQAEAVDELWAWFDAQPWIFEERSLWRWLTKRFGHAEAESLRAAFQDHYITELDVERVAALGLNLIRVPVWYDALESDYLGDAHFKPAGWARLDALAGWARTHGVYLMIDLHGAPGGQSTSWHQGLEDGGKLWTEPACVDKTARLWAAIASYFAGDPHVAVYDLLNEPRPWDENIYGPVHDALYDAIRAHDTDTIVMLEDGYLPAHYLASPSELGWDNAMYSIHLYPGAKDAADYAARVAKALDVVAGYYDRFQVPLFLGEFNAADDTEGAPWTVDAFDQAFALLNARGVHWAPWTWKYYDDHPWGVYHPAAGAGTRLDVKDASAAAIRAGFEALHSSSFTPHAAYAAVLEARAAEPVRPLDLRGEGGRPEEAP